MKTDYQQQAIDFLIKTNCEIKIEFLKNDFHFENDKMKRDIYKITLKRGNRSYSFNFGNSLNDSNFKIINKNNGKLLRVIDVPNNKRAQYLEPKYKNQLRMLSGWQFIPCNEIVYPKQPTEYDILACLTKNEVGTFEDFCNNFGYDTDSRTADKTYKAVLDEWLNIERLFTQEELEELAEIN